MESSAAADRAAATRFEAARVAPPALDEFVGGGGRVSEGSVRARGGVSDEIAVGGGGSFGGLVNGASGVAVVFSTREWIV